MEKIDRNIVIAGLARDCEKSLPHIIKLIEELRERFIWSTVIIIENDSKDNTKKLLFNWEKQKIGVKILSQDYGTVTIPEQTIDGVKPLVSFHRIEKMAMYRNIYMKYFKIIDHKIDNVIIIDVDVESFSVDRVVEAITICDDKCGSVFANGITVKRFFGKIYLKMFYDVFAVYEYPNKEIFSFSEKTLSRTLKSICNNLKKNKKYSVISAFGGIAVYNFKAIANLEYTVISNGLNKSEAVCEHIPFNTKIINLGFKNYILREMEVIYGEDSLGGVLKFYLSKRIFDFLFKLANYFKTINRIFIIGFFIFSFFIIVNFYL